jgi:hypothetical protein
MTPRKRNEETKVYVQGRVRKKVYDEFIRNAILFKGPKLGHAGLSLEEALNLFNNYFKSFDNKRLVDVAEEEGIPPYVLGARVIKRFMEMNTQYGVHSDTISDKEHLRLVKKYLNE